MTRHRRNAALAATAGLVLVAAVAGLACGTDHVFVVATILPPDAGGPCTIPGPDAGEAGAVEGDGGGTCPPAQFCEPTACGKTSGTCQTLPPSCPDGFSPVCGCDGVTYFSDCLRQSAGVQVSGSGACLGGDFVPLTCGSSGGACGQTTPIGSAVCATVLPSFLSSLPPATYCLLADVAPPSCWVVPRTPPADAGGPKLTRVDTSTCAAATAAPRETLCIDAYTALQDGGLLVESNDCP
jgi:hypothetical protein